MALVDPELDLARVGEAAVGLLVCTICSEVLIEPVFSCIEWHPVCGICYGKQEVKVCYCTGMLQINRCASRLLRIVYPSLNCRYSDSGCPEVFSTVNMTDHVRKCIYRPVKCPLTASDDVCTKRVCPVVELYVHMIEGHGLLAANGGVIELDPNSFKISHTFKLSHGSIKEDHVGKPVMFFAGCNFILVAELLDDILVWWVCSDGVENLSRRHVYDTSIQNTKSLLDPGPFIKQEKDLPVYGIRYSKKSRLNRINGCCASQSVNVLFRKGLGNIELKNDDIIDVRINILLKLVVEI